MEVNGVQSGEKAEDSAVTGEHYARDSKSTRINPNQITIINSSNILELAICIGPVTCSKDQSDLNMSVLQCSLPYRSRHNPLSLCFGNRISTLLVSFDRYMNRARDA